MIPQYYTEVKCSTIFLSASLVENFSGLKNIFTLSRINVNNGLHLGYSFTPDGWFYGNVLHDLFVGSEGHDVEEDE